MKAGLQDHKDWTREKADEIALDEYESEFYDLPVATQDIIYNKAMEAYKDAYADAIDHAYEEHRYRMMDLDQNSGGVA